MCISGNCHAVYSLAGDTQHFPYSRWANGPSADSSLPSDQCFYNSWHPALTALIFVNIISLGISLIRDNGWFASVDWQQCASFPVHAVVTTIIRTDDRVHVFSSWYCLLFPIAIPFLSSPSWVPTREAADGISMFRPRLGSPLQNFSWFHVRYDTSLVSMKFTTYFPTRWRNCYCSNDGSDDDRGKSRYFQA